MVYHKASLVATRDFWRLLTREKIPLDRLGHSFSRMDEMESKAAATYKIVLDRYPSNAKLLRSYAKFLESIKVGCRAQTQQQTILRCAAFVATPHTCLTHVCAHVASVHEATCIAGDLLRLPITHVMSTLMDHAAHSPACAC
jgi:hypothetical protein